MEENKIKDLFFGKDIKGRFISYGDRDVFYIYVNDSDKAAGHTIDQEYACELARSYAKDCDCKVSVYFIEDGERFDLVGVFGKQNDSALHN